MDTICPKCGLKSRVLDSPLSFNTRWLKDRLAAYIDHQFLVVSEQFAEMLGAWRLTGYRLEPVIHKGPEDKKQPVYQLVPTSVLPACSPRMPVIYLEHLRNEFCSQCGLRGRQVPPFHYTPDSVENAADFNLASHWIQIEPDLAVQPILISARLRQLVLESGLVLDDWQVPNKPGSQYWHFEPVILVAD